MWRLIVCVLALTLMSVPHQARSEIQQLDPEDAYLKAFESLEAGHPALANSIADALLQRNPTEYRVLILKSRAARNLGHFDEAIAAGKAAWRAAQGESQKFTAAMITAQALSSDEKRTMAQIWLRRATNVAPDDVTRALAVRDFQYVRARNPWSTELYFNVAPNNNINNGSARETTKLYGLPFEFQLSGSAQALSGIEYSAGVAKRYRFREGENFAHDAVFQFSHRTYSLTADAKAQAPGVTGSDFAFTEAAAGYIFRRRADNGKGLYSLDATAGNSWYGGDAYFSYLRFGGAYHHRLGDTGLLSFTGSGERQFGAMSVDADVLRADVRLGRQVGTFGDFGLTIGRHDSISGAEVADFSEWRAELDFTLAKPLFGADVSFGLEWRGRDYPTSRHDPSGRVDREISGWLDLTFTQVEAYGFNPTLTIHAGRTDSNIGLYESEELGVSLGVRSAF